MGMAALFLGVFLLGLLAGTLTGISASPVVSALLPLIFALLTTGGGFWFLKTHGGTGWDRLSQRKALLLGLQLIMFFIGYAPGLWLGVAAKLHSDVVWGIDTSKHPAYGDQTFSDVRVLAVIIRLDDQMERAGVSGEQRKRILHDLSGAIANRATKGIVSSDDANALAATLKTLDTPAASDADTEVPAVAIEVPSYGSWLEKLKGEKGQA